MRDEYSHVVVSGHTAGEMYNWYVFKCQSEAEAAECKNALRAMITKTNNWKNWVWGPRSVERGPYPPYHWNGFEEVEAPFWHEGKARLLERFDLTLP